MSTTIPIRFVNPEQEEWYGITLRNSCFSGGYGNGKSYIGCLKGLTLVSTFPKYRLAVVRKVYKDLRRTTMSTFYQLCPPQLYSESKGGRRSDVDGYCKLINGSEIFFIGLDNFDEQSLKSFEINSALIDQGEELDENIYLHLDSRIGRWSGAEIPPELENLPFRLNRFTGKKMAPAYMMVLCNPDSRLHWIFRRYHQESVEWQEKYRKSHVMINCPSTHNPAMDEELLQEMLSRDPEWVKRFVYGEWGISDGTIHVILPDSIIDPEPVFLANLLKKSRLIRVMDHGESSPTCVLWFAVFNNTYFCYREYYAPNKLISEHRQAIADLSGDEIYSGNWADPSIFNKTSQKNGGRWSVADEYLDRTLCHQIEGKETCPVISWRPADNNEYPIRNRINELLKLNPSVKHPVTGAENSPRMYFIQRGENHPNGCYHVIRETQAQTRELLGHENGKPIYGDEREKTISDHAYDPLRYFCSIKAFHKESTSRVIREGSFFAVAQEIRKLKKVGMWQHGIPNFAG